MSFGLSSAMHGCVMAMVIHECTAAPAIFAPPGGAVAGPGADFYFDTRDVDFMNKNFHSAVWAELPFAQLSKFQGISRTLADLLVIERSYGVSFERIAATRNEVVANK
jgi:hypothetical protein